MQKQEVKKIFSLLDDDNPAVILRQLEEEQAYRLGKEKYQFYEPNGKCEEYIQAIGCGNYFVVLFSAANGVGKTAVSANVVANIVFENKNPFFKQPIFEKWTYPKKGRIVSYPTNIDGVVDALKEWLPANRYKTKKKNKPFESAWETDTGWKWDIMTTEQDPKEFEGPTLGWVWFDEIPPKSIYKACVSRMRKGGIIFISATPLEGSGWLYDHIVDGRNDGVDEDLGELAKKQRINIEAGVEAACKQHGVRGHLEHEHIQSMIAEYDEDEKQARVEGKFQHLAGLRFKKWNRRVHVIKPFQIDRKNFCVYEQIDPHPRNPDAVLWVAVDRYNRKFIVDELWMKCMNGTEELAQNIKVKADPFRIVRRIGDPSMFIKDQHTQKSTASTLAKYGLHYIEATKARTASDRRIEDALGYVQLPSGEFIQEPEVFVFETCHRFIFEIEHYRWDEWSGRTGDKKDRKEKTVDKDDHMIENLGRALFQEPVFVPLPPRNSGNTEINFDPYA